MYVSAHGSNNCGRRDSIVVVAIFFVVHISTVFREHGVGHCQARGSRLEHFYFGDLFTLNIPNSPFAIRRFYFEITNV